MAVWVYGSPMTAKQIKEADADEAIEKMRAEFNDDGFDKPLTLEEILSGIFGTDGPQ